MRQDGARRLPCGGPLLAVSLLLLGSPVLAGNGADVPRAPDLEPDLELVDGEFVDIEPVTPLLSGEETEGDALALPEDGLVSSEEESAGGTEDAANADSAPTASVPSADASSLLELARRDPAALGPLSLGSPDAGLLFNPVPMPEGELWTIRNPAESYGTTETIDFVVTAITAVEVRHPGSPRLVVGDISRPDGGRLNRHRSHQAGRDVDLGFYYLRGECGEFKVARKGELDLPRTWTLVRALLTETDVERIFLDRRLQRLLYARALEEGEERAWLDDVFGRLDDPQHKGIVQHERRHRNHLHVRFFNKVAQERARIVYAALVETGRVPPPLVKHRVRRGETLGHLAARYHTSASAIRRANGLRGNLLRAGRAYLIPIRRVPPDNGPIVVPERRLPPAATQSVDTTPTVPGIAGPAFGRP